MIRENINVSKNVFSIKPSQEYLAKQAREQRIQARKTVTGNATIDDVMSYLDDIADRQSEIYDMLKQLTKGGY